MYVTITYKWKWFWRQSPLFLSFYKWEDRLKAVSFLECDGRGACLCVCTCVYVSLAVVVAVVAEGDGEGEKGGGRGEGGGGEKGMEEGNWGKKTRSTNTLPLHLSCYTIMGFYNCFSYNFLKTYINNTHSLEKFITYKQTNKTSSMNPTYTYYYC